MAQATYSYDSAGRVATVTDALGKVTRYAYNARGQQTRQWGDATYPMENVYDSLGRPVHLRTYARSPANFTQAAWPGSLDSAHTDTTTWTYHAATGLLTAKTDAKGRSVEYSYTVAGQMQTRQWARFLPGTTTRVTATYAYSPSTGDLTSVTYNDGTPGISYSHTRFGAIYTVNDLTGQRVFDRNWTGDLQLAGEQLPGYFGSRRLGYAYDTAAGVAGRLTRRGFGTTANSFSEQDQTIGYDAAGRLSQLSSATVGHAVRSFSYTRVPNSHLVASTLETGVGYSDVRTYDPTRDWLDARETKWGTGTQALFDYDVSGSGRDNLGRVREVRKTGAMFNRYGTGGAGVQTSYNYNDRSELTVEQTKLGGTSTLLTGRDDTYSYDHLGNRKTRSHNGTSFTWQVNELNQYVAETIPGVFDVAGAAAANATVTVNGSATGVARHGEYYFKGHPLNNSASAVFANLSVSDGTSTATVPAFVSGTPRGFAYDEDGNLRDDGRWVYVYDAENRLFWMETSGAAFNAGVPRQALQFAYDYLGRRVSKATFTWSGTAWVAQSTRRFLWRDWDLVAELDGAGATVVRHYAWGLDVTGSLTAAGGVGGLLLVQEAGQTYLPVYDALGNVHGLLRASDGQLVAAYEYDAFGNTIRESGAYAANNPFRFSTKFTDLETALVYYGLRYYSPSVGRFVNRDPIEERGGTNLYAFVVNNPTNFADNRGCLPIPLILGFGNAVVNLGLDYASSRIAGEDYSWRRGLVAAGTGFVEGAIPGTRVFRPLAAGSGRGTAVSVVGSLVESASNGDTIGDAGVAALATAFSPLVPVAGWNRGRANYDALSKQQATRAANAAERGATANGGISSARNAAGGALANDASGAIAAGVFGRMNSAGAEGAPTQATGRSSTTLSNDFVDLRVVANLAPNRTGDFFNNGAVYRMPDFNVSGTRISSAAPNVGGAAIDTPKSGGVGLIVVNIVTSGYVPTPRLPTAADVFEGGFRDGFSGSIRSHVDAMLNKSWEQEQTESFLEWTGHRRRGR